VVACGVIAEYTHEEKRPAPDMLDVVLQANHHPWVSSLRITIRGFLAYDHLNIYSDQGSKYRI